MKRFLCKILIVAVSVPYIGWSDAVPKPVSELLAEMKETGASARGGYDSELGLFLVGIGRTRYRPGAVSKSREIAQMHAVKAVTEVLGQAFKAKDVAVLQLSADDNSSEAKAFVSSMTQSSIDQLVKGVQVIGSGKNSNDEMEVAVYLTSKMADYSSTLAEMQKQWGSSGVVKAVGMGGDRRAAEMNALRSAVEQVAGTLVVGKVSMNDREELHKRLATSAGALVEEYRIISESKIEVEFRVEVIAKVSKRKLYDSYKSYFRTLDNPVFFISATNKALSRNFSQFFIDKGMQITDNRDLAQYVIQLDGRYRDRPTPGNSDSMGTMLSLSIEIVSVDGSRVLLKMNEKKAKDSEVLSREQRVEEVSRTIFEKVHARLHQAIHDMVIKMLDDVDTTPTETLNSGTGF